MSVALDVWASLEALRDEMRVPIVAVAEGSFWVDVAPSMSDIECWRDRLNHLLASWPAAPAPQYQQIIEDMQRASDAIDEAYGTSEYAARCVALALIARHFLREVTPPAAPEGLTLRFESCHLCKGTGTVFEMEGWAAPDWHACDTCHGTGKFATLPCGCTVVPPNIIASCYGGHGHVSGQRVAAVR